MGKGNAVASSASVPPFCHVPAGATPEQGACVAAAAMGLSDLDALVLLWKLRPAQPIGEDRDE